jgi:hypothetical protein
MKTKSFKFLLSAALSLLVSGCLVSKTPLITGANSDRPFPAHFSISHDGNAGESGPVDLKGDNSYLFTSPGDQSDKDNLYFKKIADHIYAVSRPMIVKETGELKGYQYGYVQIAADGRKIVFHWPDCKSFDAVEIEKMGVKIERENDGGLVSCNVPSVEVLSTLLTNYMNDPNNAEGIKSSEEDGTFYVTTR